MVLEKACDSPLDYKEIQPVHSKGNQSWIFIGRTDAEAEAPVLWPPDANNWHIGKVPDAGKDWRQKEKGTTENVMVGWTWVWASSGSWWWTGKPGVLQSMVSEKVRHDWATELIKRLVVTEQGCGAHLGLCSSYRQLHLEPLCFERKMIWLLSYQ